MISAVLLMVMAAIIIATYQGLDIVYLIFSGIQSFYAEREIAYACENPDDSFSLTMDNIEREHEITVEIYDSTGKFVYASSYKGEMSSPPYDSQSTELPESEKKLYTEVKDLGETDNNSFKLCQDTDSKNLTEYLVGTWSTDDGLTIKIFKLKSVIDTNIKLTITFISIIVMIVLAAAFLIIAIFVKRLVKPIKEMSTVTRNMSELDFSKKCEPNDIEEISVLANSINEMSDSLETALVDLTQKNKKLQEDIEQEKTIDQLRQVFISGISHELKTPIAIIQGYAEGLEVFLDSDPETAKKYCGTIKDETERMNNLVMKLLEIIKYESGEYKLQCEDFVIHDVIEEWIERNGEILKSRGITVENETDKGFVGFGDSFILSTVVNNFMSNAVSHVKEPFIIKASARETDGGCYRVSIFNTGEPIADRDINQIWNSFYRADKAMSRSQGHFGLGLAIVAAIQKMHGRDYGVTNHEDGVEFWFEVKKYEGE